MCARAGRERRPSLRGVYSANPARLQGLASRGGRPRSSSRSALWRAVQAPNRWRLRQDTPASPASRAAPAPRGHPCHLLSRRTPLEREGDAETGTALGWGARAKIARALFLRRPRARFGCRVFQSRRASPRSDSRRPRRGARRRWPREGTGAHAPWTPPPRPWAARAQQPGGGRGKGAQGARERRPSQPSPAPAGAHARPGAARPSARDPRPAPGAGGGGADVAPPFPLARPDDRLAAASRAAPWPAAHHVSGSEKAIARRGYETRAAAAAAGIRLNAASPGPFRLVRAAQ